MDGQVRLQPDDARRARLLRGSRERIIDLFRTGRLERVGDGRGGIDQGAEHDDLLSPTQVFEAFVVEVHPAIHRYVARVVGPADADDVVAETLTSVWTSWNSAPRPTDARRSWAFGIAHHRSIDHIRSATRRRSLMARLTARTTSAPSDDAPDWGVLSREGMDAIVNGLSPVERDALLLTVVGGFTGAEAGEILGCSETAITSRLTRARQRLRDTLTTTTGGASR